MASWSQNSTPRSVRMTPNSLANSAAPTTDSIQSSAPTTAEQLCSSSRTISCSSQDGTCRVRMHLKSRALPMTVSICTARARVLAGSSENMSKLRSAPSGTRHSRTRPRGL